jgi:hypothetical protein
MLAATVLAAASACSLFGPDPDRLDALFGATQTGPDAATPRACVPARPPEPNADASGGGTDRSFSVVFSALELLPPTDPRGFDLDDRCTCPEAPSCAGDKHASACDNDGGIDNKLGEAFQAISGASLIVVPQRLGQHFADGESNIILFATKYNGTDDDNDVDIYMVRSTGTTKVGDNPTIPKFDGTDPFDCVAQDAVTCTPTGIVPAVSPQHAYVHGGVLVIQDLNFVLSVIAESPIRGRGTLAAKIEPFAAGPAGEARYALRGGVLAGALPMDDLYRALALAESSPGKTFCDQPEVLGFLSSQLCASRDMTFAPPSGASADSTSCDAVSAAMSFEAVPFVAHDKASLPTIAPCSAAQALQCD